MTDDHDPRSLAEISASIDSAQQAFQRVADEAFSWLEAIDPDLVAALLELFGRRRPPQASSPDLGSTTNATPMQRLPLGNAIASWSSLQG